MKTWLWLMRLGSRTGCHQMCERSFFIKGYQLPLCARCTGVALGQLVCLTTFWLWHPGFWGAFWLVPLALDGLTQFAGWRLSNNPLRLATGLLGGYGYAACLVALARIVASLLAWETLA